MPLPSTHDITNSLGSYQQAQAYSPSLSSLSHPPQLQPTCILHHLRQPCSLYLGSLQPIPLTRHTNHVLHISQPISAHYFTLSTLIGNDQQVDTFAFPLLFLDNFEQQIKSLSWENSKTLMNVLLVLNSLLKTHKKASCLLIATFLSHTSSYQNVVQDLLIKIYSLFSMIETWMRQDQFNSNMDKIGVTIMSIYGSLL